MFPNRDRRAYTLIELVLALVIGSIVLVSLYYSLVYLFGQISGAQGDVQLRRDADLASRYIELAVREGSWAYLDSGTDSSLTAENYRNGTLQWRKDVDKNGTELLIDGPDKTESVISNLDTLDFDVHSGHVEYSLRVAEADEQYGLSSAVRLRNQNYSGIWHFTRGDQIAYDNSSKRNHALIIECGHETPTNSDWEYGPVLSFGGETAGSHLKVPDNPALDTAGRLSFSAWVQLSSSAASAMDSTGTQTLSIINRNGESTAGGGFFHVYMEAGELCYAFDSGGSIERAFSGTPDWLTWKAGTWYEVVVQCGGSAGSRWVRFYRDGRLIGVSSVGDMNQVTTGPLLIGAYDNAGTLDGMWEGKMDEVRYSTF